MNLMKQLEHAIAYDLANIESDKARLNAELASQLNSDTPLFPASTHVELVQMNQRSFALNNLLQAIKTATMPVMSSDSVNELLTSKVQQQQ